MVSDLSQNGYGRERERERGDRINEDRETVRGKHKDKNNKQMSERASERERERERVGRAKKGVNKRGIWIA